MQAVIGLVAFTTAVGLRLSRVVGRAAAFDTLAGEAVAICGASAVLTAAAVLPHARVSERGVLSVVTLITAL